MGYLNLPMATDSLLFVAFGIALFYLKLNPAPVKRRDQLFYAWVSFFLTIACVLVFTVFRAWNSADVPETQHVYRIVEIWGQGISWIFFGAGLFTLYSALTPFTSKPEKAGDSADRADRSDRSDRRGRRERAESNNRIAAVDDAGDEQDQERRNSRTPMDGSRVVSRRFGIDDPADKPDPVLEAKVEDELSSEPELVLSKDDELEVELDMPLAPPPPKAPPAEPEIVKVKTVSASISGTRQALSDRTDRPEKPKTERPAKPRTEVIPVAQRTGTNIPAGSGSRTAIPAIGGSGSRTGIPAHGASGRHTGIPSATDPDSPATPADGPVPVSVPVKPAASRSGSRPAASGIRQAAQSGTVKTIPDPEADTPSKDQYLDR